MAGVESETSMRMRIDNGDSQFHDLMVDDFSHRLRRQPVQIPLPAIMYQGELTSMCYLMDFGMCVESIQISGKTDEINGPTKDQIAEAVSSWGYGALPLIGPYPRLWEDPNNYYLGQFGDCKFDRSGGNTPSIPFSIEFKVSEKIHIEEALIPERITIWPNPSLTYGAIYQMAVWPNPLLDDSDINPSHAWPNPPLDDEDENPSTAWSNPTYGWS